MIFHFFRAVFILLWVCDCAFSESLLPITISNTTLHVEIANTHQKRVQGFQHRKVLPRDQGMLFVFPKKQTLTFWMKDTSIPLDIAFIDSEGVVFQIEAMTPFSWRPIRSQKKCALALEVCQGWFQKKGICVNTQALIPPQVLESQNVLR
jgi:uncharacterized membrane protein (UPF0127 family)